MSRAGTRLALLLLVLATVGCDRVTKHFAAETLADGPTQSFMMDTVRLEYAENTGAFLSLGANWPADVRTAVFIVGNAVLLLLVVVAAVRGRWSGPALAGATLFVAGGMSNLADRIVRGSVIDFMNTGIGPLRTGIFNVADMAIMLGVGLTASAAFRASRNSSEGVEVKPSGIEGLGVFAVRSFRAGERIRRVNVVREITPEAPIREDLGERTDHCNYPDGKIVLYGLPDRHLNHSCDPNAYEVFEDGVAYLTARREISVGDEITCDYNINIADGTAWPCRCGAKRCLGEVVGDFFRLPIERQREYRPLLAEWFVRQHRTRIDL